MNGKEFLEDYDPQIKEVGYENYSYTPEQVIKRLDDFAKLNMRIVVRQSEQFFCGVKGGVCPYEEEDSKCTADFDCLNRVTK